MAHISDTQEDMIKKIILALPKDWDHAMELAERLYKTRGGMQKLVRHFANTKSPQRAQLVVCCLARWHEETWSPKATSALLVYLLKNIPARTLRDIPEVVMTLLTVSSRVSFTSYKKKDLPIVLEFINRHGISNTSRLKSLVAPQAGEVLRRAEEELGGKRVENENQRKRKNGKRGDSQHRAS